MALQHERREHGRGLTPRQLAQLQRALEEKRRELMDKHEANLAASRTDEVLIENADVARQETIASESLGLAEQRYQLLEEVEAALERIKQGTYGISEGSGKPIPFKRLLAVPWATHAADEEEPH